MMIDRCGMRPYLNQDIGNGEVVKTRVRGPISDPVCVTDAYWYGVTDTA